MTLPRRPMIPPHPMTYRRPKTSPYPMTPPWYHLTLWQHPTLAQHHLTPIKPPGTTSPIIQPRPITPTPPSPNTSPRSEQNTSSLPHEIDLPSHDMEHVLKHSWGVEALTLWINYKVIFPLERYLKYLKLFAPAMSTTELVAPAIFSPCGIRKSGNPAHGSGGTRGAARTVARYFSGGYGVERVISTSALLWRDTWPNCQWPNERKHFCVKFDSVILRCAPLNGLWFRFGQLRFSSIDCFICIYSKWLSCFDEVISTSCLSICFCYVLFSVFCVHNEKKAVRFSLMSCVYRWNAFKVPFLRCFRTG